MATRAATVYDVAAHAGVSIATVSRVLRRPDDVRESTRERVHASIRLLGYVPSASARGLAARRTGVIGLFLQDFDAVNQTAPFVYDPAETVSVIVDDDAADADEPGELYFDKVLRGAEVEAWRGGFVLLVGVGRGADSEAMVADIAGRVDGLAVMAGSVSDDLLARLSARLPIVIVAGPRREDSFDHVSVDNRGGMRVLTERMLKGRARARVLYLRGAENSPDEVERFDGFTRAVHALTAAGAALDVQTAVAHFSRPLARELAAQLVSEGAVPDVVICANDQMALGVLEAFRERDIDVPGTVSVAGFDGIAAGRHSTPTLTTVRQPIEQLGRAAVHLIGERLADPLRSPTALRLPVEVVLRGSTAL